MNMITAEEWHNSLYSSRHGQCEIIIIEELKQIQLDAMKEGMRRAANVCCDQQKYFISAASIQCLQNHDDILTAAEQLTLKDL